MNRRLYRCRHDRLIAGVASGLAERFDVDPTHRPVALGHLDLLRRAWACSCTSFMAIIVPIEPEEEPAVSAPAGDPTGEDAAASPAGWHSTPAAHRHASRDNSRMVTFFGIALILFGALALVDTFLPDLGGWRALPVARVHPRDRGPPGGKRRATRTEPNRDRRCSPPRRTAPHPGRAVRQPGSPAERRSLRRGSRIPTRPATLTRPDRSVSHDVRETRSARSSSRRSTRPRGTRTRRSASASSWASSRSWCSSSSRRRGSPRSSQASGCCSSHSAIEGSRLVARLERRRVTLGSPNRLVGRTHIDRCAAASLRSCGRNSPTRADGGTCSTSR